VKSEYASITVPELELEIPSRSQPGEITTVEGVLTRVRDGLMQEQQQRREEDPTRAVAIDEFCARINSIMRLVFYAVNSSSEIYMQR
jgi:zinc finger protein